MLMRLGFSARNAWRKYTAQPGYAHELPRRERAIDLVLEPDSANAERLSGAAEHRAVASSTCAWKHGGRTAALAAACESNSKQDPAEPTTVLETLKSEQAALPQAPLQRGDRVYDFSALAHTGQRFKLSDFLGLPVLVYFCPEDRSPLCTQMAVSLRDDWLLLNSSLGMAFAVSDEDTLVHRDFASEHQLPHLMVADQSGSVHQVFGLERGEITGYIVGKEREVLHVFAQPNTAAFGREVLSSLRELGLEKPPSPI
jgi:peroxiredoxin Q/BCP